MNEEAQMKAAADKMNQMSPENLKAQAAALRSMNPAQVRIMNPQMAGFSDAQILEAADQMEQMANDPALIKAAADELRNMSPEQMADIKRMMGSESGSAQQPAAAAPAAPVPGFPVGTRIILHGLQAAPQFNGKHGVVKSAVNAKGRQNVEVDGEEKAMLLRPTNMEPEPKDADELSESEARQALAAKGVGPDKTDGLERAKLLELVEEHVMPDDDLAVLIAEGANGVPAALKAKQEADAALAAQQEAAKARMDQAMNPETLKMQAKALRTMPPDEVRKRMPHMAAFSDAQILQAADEMEQMADDPEMRQRSLDEMKKMSPGQLEQMKRQAAGAGGQNPAALRAQAKGIRDALSSGQGDKLRASNPQAASMTDEQLLATADRMEAGAAQLEANGGRGNMMPSPDALVANAKALRQAIQAGHGDRVRASNAQMASLTDAQILAAADQMEAVASNPQMMAMAKQQMQNMTPEQIEEAKKQAQSQMFGAGGGAAAGGGGGGGGGGMGGGAPTLPSDPSSLMSMDPKQLKMALTALKSSPAMAKQAMAGLPGGDRMSDAQLMAQLEQLSSMDEKELEQFLRYASTAQAAMMKVRGVWDIGNQVTGGHLAKVLALLALAAVGLAVKWLFFSSLAKEGAAGVDDDGAFGAGFASSSAEGSAATASGAAEGVVGVGVGPTGEVEDEFD